MKKITKYILILFLLFTAIPVFAQDLSVHMFVTQGCPHCKAAKKFIENYQKSHDFEIKIEDVYAPGNEGKMDKLVKYFNTNIKGTPFIVIGDDYVLGDNQSQIQEKIDFCLENGCEDVLEDIWQGKEGKKNKDLSEIKIPILNITLNENVSLTLITIAMGFIDGFNPCAMWALLFLITLLLGMKDKKRRYILGITFIFISAAVYYGFMAGWLNIIQRLNTDYLQIGIGILALILGINYIIKSLSKKSATCKVSKMQKNQQIFAKLKEFVQKPNIFVALLGISVLAFFVNLVDLLCSAALPVVYTQILTASHISGIAFYLYLLLYILFFMIDDIIIFVIAMYTLKVVGVSNKYNKLINVIAGVIMIGISIFLIF